MSQHGSLHVTVDRIEGETAVLLSSEAHRWLLPARLLPEGVEEGDVLLVTLSRDPRETDRRRGRIRELQRKLLDRTGGVDGEG